MKRFAITVLCLTISSGALCQEYSASFGASLSHALKGISGIRVEYVFNTHWSISGSAGINVKGIMKGPSIIEQEHDGEFETPSSYVTPWRHRMEASFRYWPQGNICGPYLSIGIMHDDSYGADIPLVIGYGIDIRHGLGITISYSMPLIRHMQEDSFSTSGLNMEFRYAF